MSPASHLALFVTTGDRKYAGTNNTVNAKLHSNDGKASKTFTLNNSFSDDLERGTTDKFSISVDDLGELDTSSSIVRLEIWKESTLSISDDWFMDKAVVEDSANTTSYVFPFFRWIKSRGHHYNIQLLDTCLPQFEPFPDQRKREIGEQRETYQYGQKMPDGPAQVKTLPPDEHFSFAYMWDIVTTKTHLKIISAIAKLFRKKWTKLEDITRIFDATYEQPRAVDTWKSDAHFARKRIASINPLLICLMTSVPDNFPITDELLKPLLEDVTIQEAIQQKRLFLCDLSILEGINAKPGTTLCKPLALFFVNKEQQLVPVAIQLFQEPGPENPIFTPLDDPLTWMYVKMWFDNSDAAYHQALTHLGLTHLMMEGVAVAAHRNLSPSHPIFKILAPHFLFIIAINWRALSLLVSPGGWIDKTMAYGCEGIVALAPKGMSKWRMNVEGLLPEDLKARGVADPSVLPGYHFREDASMLFDAIKKYATAYVHLYYETPEMIKEDVEIQAFANELVKEKSETDGGVGIKGVPGNGSLDSFSDLIDIVTSIIYISSVAHASANFGQYEEYAFPPNYPTLIKGKPPTSKDAKLTESEIVNSLADESTTQDILTVTKLLSRKSMNSLGDFEVQYVFDPKATVIVDEFKKDLEEIGHKIKAMNEKRETPYTDLLPEGIPNSISI